MASTETPTCSQASLDVGEPIFATAITGTDLWLLIEHDGQWAPNILDSPGLAPRTRAWIEAFLADHPTARPQFIRCDAGARAPARPKRFFFARSGDVEPGIWAFEFHDPVELEAIDLRALAADRRPYPEARRTRPLFLVCTHGKRDACCARLGPAIARGLHAEWGDSVWQSSPVGGHRFAATMVCLPWGHCFGRLDTAAALRVARGYAARRLTDLLNYRGRTAWTQPVQAAEFFLRQELGVYGIDALRYSRGEMVGEDRWRVCFFEKQTGETHELTVVKERGADLAPTSCGGRPEPVSRFVLESHRHLT